MEVFVAIDTQNLVYLIDPFWQAENNNGKPIVNGHMEVFIAGTDTKYITWQNWDGTKNPFKIPLGSDGRATILVEPEYTYDCYLYDSFNNLAVSRLNVKPNLGGDVYGLSQVYHDDTLTGNGTVTSPLGMVSAKLGVQEPLYFVEDDSATVIGLRESAYSGLPYVENSAIGYDMAGNITSISGLGFYARSAAYASIANNAFNANVASISYLAKKAEWVTSGWETGSDGRITAYNGTAFSAGKVYSGISPVYVDNENDQIGVSSKDFLANSPLYFTEYSDRVELSISGLPDTPGLMYESGFNYESGKITGYNGSGISAGKVYTGIDPVHVDNVNDTISLDSATLGVQTPLYFVEDSESATIIGLNTAQIQVDIPESANWNEAYSTVANNSASWTSAADELAVLNTAKWDSTCDYVSSHSADWNNKLDADIYAEDSGTFLTALPSDVVYTADIQDMATTGDINDLVTSIAETYQTKTDMTGYLTTGDSSNFYTTANESGFITGVDLTDYATTNYVDSSVSGKYDTSSFSAVSGNFLTGLPSDLVYTADIQDMATTGQVAEKLDTTAFSTVSANFLTAHQSLPESADWNSAASTVSAGYANWDASYGTLTANSANWDSTYTTVSDNSANWTGSATYTGDAQGALDEVYSNSANWNSTYTAVSSNSATWGQGGSDGIVVIDMTLGSYDPQEIYNTINSSWGLKSIYAKVNSYPTTYGPVRTLNLPINIRYPYDDGGAQSGYIYEGRYQYSVDGQYALNGQQFQVGYDSINDNYIISTPQVNPDMPVPISWPEYSGRVLTVRDDGGIEWQTPQGGALPQSASDAIDVVTGGSANWNSTTNTVSSNSANWNNVTGKLDVSAVSSVSIPLHGLFVSGIDNKPIFAKDALSANYAKYDVNGRSLTRCLTAVPAGTMNESNFGYDVSNNITAYNGSAFKAASQITRGIDSNPDATGYRVFTWPETGNAQNINVVDYTNNNMLSINAGSLSWNNAQGVNAMTLASADVQKFKKATGPVNMNSYDNPGWETAGTITSRNPFGVGINFAAAYENYYIYNSRCVSQYLGNSLWNIDLYVSFTGTPKNNWYLYSDFLTIQSGHFSAPTNSFIRDQWNNSFGCLTKDTIYSTGLDYIAHEPHTPTNAQFINLHTLVAEW